MNAAAPTVAAMHAEAATRRRGRIRALARGHLTIAGQHVAAAVNHLDASDQDAELVQAAADIQQLLEVLADVVVAP